MVAKVFYFVVLIVSPCSMDSLCVFFLGIFLVAGVTFFLACIFCINILFVFLILKLFATNFDNLYNNYLILSRSYMNDNYKEGVAITIITLNFISFAALCFVLGVYLANWKSIASFPMRLVNV